MMTTRSLRPAARVAGLIAALLMGGCTNLAPTYQRPAAPVPAALPWPVAASAAGIPARLPGAGAPAPATAASSAPGGAAPVNAEGAWTWRALVRQPRQVKLIELALANNRDLRAAMLNVERSRALLGVSEADRLPTVGAGLNASRAPSPVNGKQANLYTAGLQVNAWEADFFGRIANLNDAARAQLLSSTAGQRSAELSLAAALLATDLSLAADGQLLGIAERSLASRRETLKLTQLREQVGAASVLELQAALSLVAQAEVAQVQAARQRQLDLNALHLLAGAVVPDELLAPVPPLPLDVLAAAPLDPIDPFGLGFAAVPAGLGSDVLLDRPDVVQAEQLLIGATANIGAARAAFWPRITLTSSVGLASAQLASLLQAGSLAWTLAGQALLTVFDSGRNDANLRVSEVSRDIAIAAYEKALQSAFRETADALAGLQSWREQVAAQERLRDASADTVRLTELRHSRGAASELERLDAQRSLLAAEQALIGTRLAEAQNRVALFKALGR
jgi:NodT family efflux transporter outer membrane factor (OMF) lipoprotein